ncbi:hypothetical protein E4U41_007132 [Claviceps citrina]|nr:hypothetical protein E4U41_007132 [Claviceps citrina]
MHGSPPRTPILGHDGFCSSVERTPRSTGDALNLSAKNNVTARRSPTAWSTAVSEARSAWPEPDSPPKQQSPLRISAVPGAHSASEEGTDGPFSSPTSRYTLESLRKQCRARSLAGDKTPIETQEPSSTRSDAWYMRHDKNNVHEQMEAQNFTTEDTTPTKPRSSSRAASVCTPASAETRSKVISSTGASRFSLFNMAAFKGPTTSPIAVPKDDDLMNLDINATLFPTGIPQDGESFSITSFKNLQMNATVLLRRFQCAYQDKAIACNELRAERDAKQDEKMEMETRTAYLKMQLQEMAHKANETEAMMHALMQELNHEKRLREQERTARQSVVLSSGTSTMSEDLGAEDDQRKKHHRRSAGTMKSDDAGFDTDDESIDEVSLFSRSRSPTLATSPVDGPSTHSGPTTAHASQGLKSNMLEPPRPSRQSQPQQVSAFQKLMKGISADIANKLSVQGCQNCQGQDASMAWDTASLLRAENRGLKQRVGDLEAAIEDALDAVMGVTIDV